MSQKRTFQQLDSSENSERPTNKQKVGGEQRADNVEDDVENIVVNFGDFDDINLVIMNINLDNRRNESIFDAINKANKNLGRENNKKIATIVKDLTRDVKERVIKHIKNGYLDEQITFEHTYSFPVEHLIKSA